VIAGKGAAAAGKNGASAGKSAPAAGKRVSAGRGERIAALAKAAAPARGAARKPKRRG
jgi:hypothetical protein